MCCAETGAARGAQKPVRRVWRTRAGTGQFFRRRLYTVRRRRKTQDVFDLGVGGRTGAREEFQTWLCRSGWGMAPFCNGRPGLGKIARGVLACGVCEATTANVSQRPLSGTVPGRLLLCPRKTFCKAFYIKCFLQSSNVEADIIFPILLMRRLRLWVQYSALIQHLESRPFKPQLGLFSSLLLYCRSPRHRRRLYNRLSRSEKTVSLGKMWVLSR